ncbi:MAG TPA: GNAT family N-acetyltransferase [Planctomycetota bacterium]
MLHPSGLSTRELHADDAVALALAKSAGVHGIYAHNALVRNEGLGFVIGLHGEDVGLCWFGARGNLVILGPEGISPSGAEAVAEAVRLSQHPWRIAMGPTTIVNALRELTIGKPLMLRDQVYYIGTASHAAPALVDADVRTAGRADRDRLLQATLLLNSSDLNIDQDRVDRRWLRDTIDERIAGGLTRVLGPVGGLRCKLDFGSDGPGGLVLEGVFTFPEHRGAGLASRLVATCLHRASGTVCLHVGMHNSPARAAYERAGMALAGRCRLLLLA